MLKSGNAGRLEVLVVDDDKVVTLLHKNSLKSSRIEHLPVLCYNGKEALDYLQKNDRPDKHFLILLDLNMPVLDGWKFLNKLKKNPPQAQVYVIVVTSSINQQDYLKAQTYDQVIHFCRKPLSPECILKIKKLEPVRQFFLRGVEETKETEK
ncbi:response regulator [Salinimicrobium sediminilitoris]|uniref:response regulator n=1 Tax=Salinimicrobium sediminilitoris TaxID=2876715 RepID=UPI001E37476C|nr:response regulator [Salinimicrobium sediminilitoris]MCC8358387.1 response regulator [Salinimicrobium sediminilitoris]